MATAARVVEDARSLLSLVVALAAIAMGVTGAIAVGLSEARLVTVRLLATRTVLSALSFAVLFRIGSWALDPDRGGSPIARGGSVLLGSNADVFLLVAGGAAAVSGVIAWILWRRRRDGVAGTAISDSDADTRELLSI